MVGKINIENLFTIGYEGKGNRILLDLVYIYAHDLATRYYQTIDNVPHNTFLAMPKLLTLNDFLNGFLTEFFK